MCKKRGQATIIILIAIILIFFTTIILFIRNEYIESKLDSQIGESILLPPQVVNVKNYVQDCVEQTLLDGTRLIGLQGGYVIPPELSVETNFSIISYGYYVGKKTLPTIKKIEQEISLYIELTLPLCFDTSYFPEFEINYEETSAKTEIREEQISTLVVFPVSVSKEDSTYNFGKFSGKIPIRLGSIYLVADGIINNEIEDPDRIDLTYLTNSDYDIAILPITDNLIIYSITDEESIIDDIPYTFMFANRLSTVK